MLTWVYGNAAARLLLRRAISATMILALLAITARSALAWWSGSAIVYFLQPELGTICISVAFVVSVWLRRPLVGKLISDYIHLPTRLIRHARMQRCFARLTLLWAVILLLNAGMSIWLLLSQTIEIYLLVRPLAVAGTCGLAFLGSVWIFLRLLRHIAHQSSQSPALKSPAAAGAH
ncbi:VC0807 family protein [Nonomuraea endophytica]|uniref:VC0807 family protein n=1 Tax=Nonomuraea endophytica TaxID=714136 RepID=UPI0037C6D52F